MYAVHGTICNTKTFPLTCRSCSSRVFFFQCDCGARVFFDSLGPPWPEHDCRNNVAPLPPRPSGKEAWLGLRGVTFSKEDSDSGLLPRMRRFGGTVSESVIRRGEETQSMSRETVRIEPRSSRQEVHQGIVSDVHVVALERRFGIRARSVGGQAISKLLGSFDITQMTILVDDFLIDPEAIDIMSYTVWCATDRVPASLETGVVVGVTIKPEEIMSVGRRWVVKSLERLL